LRRHDVAVGPGEVVNAYFTPLPDLGDLWEQVASGVELDTSQQNRIRSLLTHEYVEAKLMEAGLPYVSADPGAGRSL
jgi:hypothetical protein